MIRFACPGCSTTFTVGDEKAGKTGKCPKCQSQFVIPDAPAAEPPPLPAAPPPLPPVAPPPPPRDSNDPIEIQPCPKCGSRLSVLPSDVGLDIECPSCQTVFKAYRADAPPPPATGSRSSSSKLVKLGSGSDREDDDDRPSKRKSKRRRDDDDDDDDYDNRPSRRRSRSRRSYRGDYAEHRGTMLLVFSILGWFVCLIFAIVAWVMANQDLAEMDAGRMDPEGRGMTQAARIISMIAVILTILGVIAYCGFMVLIVGIGAAAR